MIPAPVNVTRRSGGVVVGGVKSRPVIVTSWLSRPRTSGPLTPVTVGVPVSWKAPALLALCPALTLVTLTSRDPSEVPGDTSTVTVICVGLSTDVPVTDTPAPKDTLASGAKFAPVRTTVRPTAPRPADAGATVASVGPAAGVTAVPFFTDWDSPNSPGLGPKTVISTSADVTSGGRKPGGTSTVIPDTRRLAGPCVEA